MQSAKNETANAAWATIAMVVIALLIGLAVPGQAQSSKSLPEKYRTWLDEEVVYIISREERALFLRLATDADREKFMEQFWAARDPSPGTPENEYKTEHYKRIAYANQHFAMEWSREGWRTDRGKIWIILGQPQTRNFYTSGGQVYPIELWFYSTSEPALPPFFHVMFYQKDGMSDYRLYSPYLDGPDKLVRGSGMENDKRRSYRFLRDVNVELASASLSLIPSEPGDLESPSLSSDTMLMKVINIKDDKYHKQKVLATRQLQEEVTSRLIRDPNALQAAALPLRDANGEDFIHYALQIPEPQDYTLTKYKDKYYLAMEVQVKVLDAQKKLIYQTTREAVSYFEEKDLDDVRTRPYSFEDRLPAVPGSYLLEFGLLNRVTRAFYKASTTVQVEALPAAELAMGRPLMIQKCLPRQAADEPFNFGGSRCTPLAKGEIAPGANATVNLLFPVFLPPATQGAPEEPLKIQYTLGRLDRGVKPTVVEDTLDRKRANQFGTLLVGKSIPAKEFTEGSYLLSIQVADPVSKKTAGATIPVRIGGAAWPTPNIMTAQEGVNDARNGNNDYWRGLCAQAAKQSERARTLFQRALEQNDQLQSARNQLAGLYYAEGDFQKAAALLEAGDVNKIADAETLRKFVGSLEKTGQLQRAISTAEQALKRIEPTAALYEDLAGLYEKAGQGGRAREAREEAKKLGGSKKTSK